MAKSQISLTVNGKKEEALVEPRTLLIHFLREQLNLTGPHIGCDTTHCGACTVDLDGKSVKSCTVFAVQANGADIRTIEGTTTSSRSRNPAGMSGSGSSIAIEAADCSRCAAAYSLPGSADRASRQNR